jgi:hypothetical protein
MLNVNFVILISTECLVNNQLFLLLKLLQIFLVIVILVSVFAAEKEINRGSWLLEPILEEGNKRG